VRKTSQGIKDVTTRLASSTVTLHLAMDCCKLLQRVRNIGPACRREQHVFTARCTLVQSAVLPSHVVCLSVRQSVCNVGGL